MIYSVLLRSLAFLGGGIDPRSSRICSCNILLLPPPISCTVIYDRRVTQNAFISVKSSSVATPLIFLPIKTKHNARRRRKTDDAKTLLANSVQAFLKIKIRYAVLARYIKFLIPWCGVCLSFRPSGRLFVTR